MALEDKIDALIEALNANTKALSGSGGGSGKAASGGSKPAAAAAAKKGPTLDAVVKRYGAYMAAEGDDGKAMVRKVVKHFDGTKISELDESKYQEALDLLDKIEAGEDPFDSEEDLM